MQGNRLCRSSSILNGLVQQTFRSEDKIMEKRDLMTSKDGFSTDVVW
jgi:hypothetical protein